MSAPAYAIPISLKSQDVIPELASLLDIAELAYTIWQARGSPLGSPDGDWFAAEIGCSDDRVPRRSDGNNDLQRARRPLLMLHLFGDWFPMFEEICHNHMQ